MKDESEQRLDQERKARQRLVMQQRWQDPEFRQKTLKSMKEKRSTDKMRAQMRRAQWGAAKRRTEQTGVVPHWTPKRVKVKETTGKWHTYDSIRKCAAHYCIGENNLRAIIKQGREYMGMQFIAE